MLLRDVAWLLDRPTRWYGGDTALHRYARLIDIERPGPGNYVWYQIEDVYALRAMFEAAKLTRTRLDDVGNHVRLMGGIRMWDLLMLTADDVWHQPDTDPWPLEPVIVLPVGLWAAEIADRWKRRQLQVA